MRRIFHLSCAAQLGQLSFRATALLGTAFRHSEVAARHLAVFSLEKIESRR